MWHLISTICWSRRPSRQGIWEGQNPEQRVFSGSPKFLALNHLHVTVGEKSTPPSDAAASQTTGTFMSTFLPIHLHTHPEKLTGLVMSLRLPPSLLTRGQDPVVRVTPSPLPACFLVCSLCERWKGVGLGGEVVCRIGSPWQWQDTF